MARRAEPLKPPKAAPHPERLAAFKLGLSAESRAAMFLIAKAYQFWRGAGKPRSAKSISSPAAATPWSLSKSKARATPEEAAEAVT